MNESVISTAVLLKAGTSVSLSDPHFYHSTNGAKASQHTDVRLSVEKDMLVVAFECRNDPFVEANTMYEHNTDLWKQEVFELFIAAGSDTPTRYLEVELNPNNALFVGWITNETGLQPSSLTMVLVETSGIRHQVRKDTERWSGEIRIPLSLVGLDSAYRLNFYRIALKTQPTQPDWECTPENCDFLCWRPTLSGEQPAFHRPDSFGLLELR